MRVTNKHNLPQPLYRALARDDYENKAKFSATSLIKSPRQRLLMQRHWKKIEVDAVDRLWMVLGTLAHLMLQRAGDDNALVEETLWASQRLISDAWIPSQSYGLHYYGKPTIASTFDRYSSEGIIQDWKLTSVWAYILGGLKPEWEAQVNIYAWLARLHGLEVSKLQIIALFRDHVKGRAEREPDYPDIPIQIINVPLWPHDKTEAYVNERVRLHLEAEELADDDLPLCTPEERWVRDEKWAVKKRGGKKAIKNGVFDSLVDAQKRCDQLGADVVYIEHRPGESARCKKHGEGNAYCDAAPFCNQNPYKEQT